MTLNIAHRGFSGLYPENTMIAFKKAIEANCDGIETDVHMTKDGVLILCHDERVDRTTDGTGFIKDYTFENLRKLDAGIKFGEEFNGEKIPTLDELLVLAKDNNIQLNIEIKTGIVIYDGIEKAVIDKVKEYGMENRIILSSFNHYAMVLCKSIDKNIKTGLLYMEALYKPQLYAKQAYADALHPLFYTVLNEEVVKGIQDAGIEINTYTVNEEPYMMKLVSLGVTSIITNYPDKLSKILKNII